MATSLSSYSLSPLLFLFISLSISMLNSWLHHEVSQGMREGHREARVVSPPMGKHREEPMSSSLAGFSGASVHVSQRKDTRISCM